MRTVPTLVLAAALTLGAGASFATDLITAPSQTYRVYNSNGSYTEYTLPAGQVQTYRVYNADGSYSYVAAPAQPAGVKEYRAYNSDGSYTTYVVASEPEPYRAVPQVVYTAPATTVYTAPAQVYSAPAQTVYTAPTQTYVYAPATPYATYQPQSGVTRQDGTDVFLVRYDTDGDGDLRDEQQVLRTRAELDASGDKVVLMESHSVEPVDTNGDGFITANEWRAEHGQYFGSLDLNNNGTPDDQE